MKASGRKKRKIGPVEDSNQMYCPVCNCCHSKTAFFLHLAENPATFEQNFPINPPDHVAPNCHDSYVQFVIGNLRRQKRKTEKQKEQVQVIIEPEFAPQEDGWYDPEKNSIDGEDYVSDDFENEGLTLSFFSFIFLYFPFFSFLFLLFLLLFFLFFFSFLFLQIYIPFLL